MLFEQIAGGGSDDGAVKNVEAGDAMKSPIKLC
jgi:hypothetical protein